MRNVFSSHRKVAQVWASQTQSEGSASRVFFEAGTIYSYGKHFPIARILKDGKTCLFTTKGYSNSTSKHIGHTRWAAHEANLNVIYCYDIQDTEASLKHWEANIREIISQLGNKRNRDVAGRIESIRNYVLELEAYCKLFNIILDFEFATLVAFVKGTKETELVNKIRQVA